MSWNPFKKAFSGRRTRAEDVEFEREVNRLRQMQAVSKRMYKDMQKCSEADTAVMRADHKILSAVKSSSFSKSEPLKAVVEVKVWVTDELQGHCRALRASQEIVFTEPIKKFSNVYKHVIEFHAKQRELKLQEYDKHQSRLEKYERRMVAQPGSQSNAGMQTKLDQTQRALTSAKTDYERVHQRMVAEMPELFDGRVGYFEHCVKAVIETQALYYHKCSETLLEGFSKLHGSAELMSEEELAGTTEQCLTDLRALSIVGGTSS